MVRLTNAERAKAGCGPLHVDNRLATAARAHSEDMARRDYFSHQSPDGVSPWDRARAAGYSQPAAENIARGQSTPESVVSSWMSSPGHRANIVNCESRAIGAGVSLASRGPVWTQMFGYA